MSVFSKLPLILFSCLVPILLTQPVSAQLPLMGEQSALNLEQERQLGFRVYRGLLEKDLIETHPLIDGYINDLGDRLLGGLDNSVRSYRFFVVRNDAINAFAVPGGFIGINRGLILRANSLDQLASVIAHEIAHVELRHGMQMMDRGRSVGSRTTMTTLAGILLSMANPAVGAATLYGGIAAGQQEMINYTRENEYEADRLGVGLMQSAGFQADGMVGFFRIMQNMALNSGGNSIEYLRTHPLDTNRISEAQGRVQPASSPRISVGDFGLFKAYLQHTRNGELSASPDEFSKALWETRYGSTTDALSLIEPLFKANPENLWYTAVYADALEQQQRFGDAAAVYQRLLAIYPEHYYLSLKLIGVLQQMGRYDEALELARGQERVRPNNRSVLFALSSIYDSLGRTWLSKFSQAEYHRLSGNKPQAIKLYDEILKSGEADQATEFRAREQKATLTE